MKKIKVKMIWFGIIMLAGIILFSMNIIKGDSDITIAGFASGLVFAAIAKIAQFIRISRSPQLLKEYEIYQKEERLISIAEKSGRFTMIVTLFAEFVALCVLISIYQSTIATIVSFVVCFQIIIYLVTYYYLCRKY